MRKNIKIGLSFSGGGYRAAAYHIGVLKKLHEMNVLEDIDVISSVSGGSITSAFYALWFDDFLSFEKEFKSLLSSNIIKGILMSKRFLLITFVMLFFLGIAVYLIVLGYYILSFLLLITIVSILINHQFYLLPISKINEDLYNRFFFNDKKIGDFRENPIVAINSTNLETGRLFTFSKFKMSDSSYEFPKDEKDPIIFNQNDFPVARAVAASTCVPFAFTPVAIDKYFFNNKTDFKRAKPQLIDGGVYDNQGIHKISQRGSFYNCDIIVTSDAGNILPYQNSYRNTLQLLIRTSEIFMNRIKNFQMIKHVYTHSITNNKEVVYFSLGWDISNSIPEFISKLRNDTIPESLISAHGITQDEVTNFEWETIEKKLKKNVNYSKIISQYPDDKEVSLARSVKTNLKPLKSNEINALIKHAYCMSELHIKLYCPSIL